ncbi:hypothetical protein GRI38_05125 [Altererythrobacter aurantiacus]|uniref:Uncharacterized protein n=1 Tax=Parapontixanthobacter aurantiacus TaxID=1463599 RepID=A0A844ZE20_9SPHN|nr:hypothetical protein [Parapontixanthobacter aurantiacus]MXO85406.1 hypothetical protein [Parapontixanthobacter aurantiacus]
MRCVILGPVLLVTAACGTSSEEAAVADEVLAVEDDVALDDGTAGLAGTYELTSGDGSVVLQVLSPDGTYRDTTPGGEELERGSWRSDGEGICLDADGPATERCMTGSEVGPDGSWRAIDSTGADTGTVVRQLD